MARIFIDDGLPEAEESAPNGLHFDEDDIESLQAALMTLEALEQETPGRLRLTARWLRDRIEVQREAQLAQRTRLARKARVAASAAQSTVQRHRLWVGRGLLGLVAGRW